MPQPLLYYAVRDAITTWRGQYVQAAPIGEVPSHQMHWLQTEPFAEPVPLISLKVNPKWPHTDNLFTGIGMDLYSERMIAILDDAGVKFETFPVQLVDRKSKEVLPATHRFFHLLEDGTHLDQKVFFRHRQIRHVVLVREDLRRRFEEEGITGCFYANIKDQEFHDGWAMNLWEDEIKGMGNK